ncbi:tRNA (adenosine(37)-N6)-threonylcarbamoyltransferase complex dimerization subunit type 1 TsaB [Sinimarinibacterium thermocellulolyticum]|uniref:tRNA threonylcarbamoyladenosine biosynthesis protein TsaB n=1 Tax=Sinimarinibacterium thermocellulolyticum TaxID=3170016 RepID=A0ABV2AAR4_9GAMM
MKLLAIDTATEACSVALHVDGQILADHVVAGRSHTERLMPMVYALLAQAGLSITQLDGYVCGIGPGSFAGVRIGVGYVKGLALAHERPVAPVSSLATLALPPLRSGAARVLAAIDARLDEVYLGVFAADADGLPQTLRAETVCAPQAAPALEAGEWIAVGSGWGRYADALRAATGVQPSAVDAAALPRADDALAIGLACLRAGRGIGADALAPAYLRNKVALTLEEQRARRS